jgi:acetyl/propionyl-CoA carboxylase alpha subunit
MNHMALVLLHNDREYLVDVMPDGRVRVDGELFDVSASRGGHVVVGGRPVWIARDGDARWVFYEGRTYVLSERRAAVRRRSAQHDGALSAPMPATVRRILVSVRDKVKAGDTLIVLEAMKMELPIRATEAGTVRALHCKEGDLVQPGVPLLDLDHD